MFRITPVSPRTNRGAPGTRGLVARLLLCILPFAPGLAVAADWPTQQAIRFVVPASAGGSLDTLTRPLAQRLSESLGQAVVVDNRGGAAGMVGADHVAKSKPDGYTFLMGAIHHAIIPGVYDKVPYDSKTDLVGVAHIGKVPNMVIVGKSVPAETPQELIAWIRSDPGKVSYGTGGAGALHHIASEMFKAGIGTPEVVGVHYRGSSPAIRDLLAGQIHMMFETMPGAAAQVRADRVKPIAVTSRERSPAFPDVPTLAESGLDGFEVVTWYGVFAPAGTPPAVIERMHSEIAQALQSDALRETWKAAGVDAIEQSQADFHAYWLTEVDRWTSAARKLDITMN